MDMNMFSSNIDLLREMIENGDFEEGFQYTFLTGGRMRLTWSSRERDFDGEVPLLMAYQSLREARQFEQQGCQVTAPDLGCTVTASSEVVAESLLEALMPQDWTNRFTLVSSSKHFPMGASAEFMSHQALCLNGVEASILDDGWSFRKNHRFSVRVGYYFEGEVHHAHLTFKSNPAGMSGNLYQVRQAYTDTFEFVGDDFRYLTGEEVSCHGLDGIAGPGQLGRVHAEYHYTPDVETLYVYTDKGKLTFRGRNLTLKHTVDG